MEEFKKKVIKNLRPGLLEFSEVITKEEDLELQLFQLDKLASLGQLVSGVAHEINNPNTFIQGNILILQEAIKDIIPILDEYYEGHPNLKIARLKYEVFRENIVLLIEDILRGANRIKTIVDDLRQFTRYDEGYLNDDVNINDVIENCVRIVKSQLTKSVKVKFDLALNIPDFKGNIQKLEQVIINMLINASQSIKKEKGTITISSVFREDTKKILIKITDDGHGMDEGTIKQIFKPFFTTRKNQGGTGLGLSIACEIIKEHNGKIHVTSQLYKGTTFTIVLPLQE